jgi:anti-sigma factor RsiW
MDCGTAREGLWPPERPRLADDDVVEARRHVESCAACQEYFRQDRALLDAYDRMRANVAPARVRERVFDALARERAALSRGERINTGVPRYDRTIARGSAAALAIFVLGMIAWLVLGRRSGPADGATMFLEDWLRRAVATESVETSDPEVVRQFVARELGIAHAPLRIRGFEIEAAEICLLSGRRGALIRYASDGRIVSHYVLPSADAEPREPALMQSEPGAGPAAVVTWAAPSIEYALVGDLPPESLLQFARSASR